MPLVWLFGALGATERSLRARSAPARWSRRAWRSPSACGTAGAAARAPARDRRVHRDRHQLHALGTARAREVGRPRVQREASVRRRAASGGAPYRLRSLSSAPVWAASPPRSRSPRARVSACLRRPGRQGWRRLRRRRALRHSPSLLTMPDADRVLERAGVRTEDVVALRRLNPAFRRFADGQTLDIAETPGRRWRTSAERSGRRPRPSCAPSSGTRAASGRPPRRPSFTGPRLSPRPCSAQTSDPLRSAAHRRAAHDVAAIDKRVTSPHLPRCSRASRPTAATLDARPRRSTASRGSSSGSAASVSRAGSIGSSRRSWTPPSGSV